MPITCHGKITPESDLEMQWLEVLKQKGVDHKTQPQWVPWGYILVPTTV